ncbi:histidine acid phosphatase [Ancylostoma caninum]|uniref:Histidine acid phosphatase n=1 Tax=Ancylostoma caninum TaxID=29170 RepID=A0A368H8Q7_ANCCA|nr:histidine acid phosphatase [Ancylostoma caninum]
MLATKLTFLVLMIRTILTHPNTAEIVRRDPNTKLVLWGTRHGNRNPEQFVYKTPSAWGFEGNTELTQFGKRQAYGLGRELRRFVGDLVDGNYLPPQAKYYSSSANRCQMTLQTALAGFYTPTGWADWQRKQFDFWSPVPYSIDDPLLRMYAVKDCPASDQAWNPISKDTLPDLAKIVSDNRRLLSYIARNTNWTASVSSAADLADNIIEMDLYGSPYPSWIANPSLPGFSGATFKQAVLSFGEKHQIRCTEYEPCRNLMGGVWLNHILESIDNAVKGKGPRVIGYSSHTEVTLAVLKLLGVDRHELTTSAGFLLEYRNLPSPSVRILNHDPDPIDKHIIYKAKYTPELSKIADKSGWIPKEKFAAFAAKHTIKDWKTACGRPTCKPSLPLPYV